MLWHTEPEVVDAASDRTLDQDDADAEEGRRFKQVYVIDEKRVECRKDKDQSNDPFERSGSGVRRCVGS